MITHARYIGLFLAGALSHLVYFRKGEHHLYVLAYIECFLTAICLAVFLLNSQEGGEFVPSFLVALNFGACFLSGIYSSSIVYRLVFHPLNMFPGSFGARISNFWLPFTLRARDGFRQVRRLHDKHGPFVRLAPDYLSIAHPKAVGLVYGAGSKCTKAAWYDLTKPMVSLQTFRKKSLHDERRRVWSTAFGDRALRGYETRMQIYRRKLLDYIVSLDGQPLNVTKWFNLYSFDVMGDLAFGKSFEMLENQEHGAIKLLNDAIGPLGFGFPTWFFRLMTAVPGLTRDWWRFIDFCARQLEQRLITSTVTPDITSALSAPLKGKKPTEKEWDLLRGDAQLIVVAGSDTTATTLSAAMFELAQHPRHIELLRQELMPHMDPSGEVFNDKIANLKHLNAVINETLRLHPPVPTALQRKTPPEGMAIDETFIPGNTTVICPQYVLGRSNDLYEDPNEFVPERWTTCPDMIKDRSAFAPFSTGPYGCIGKPLALLNIRTTIARLVTAFDFSFGPGEDGQNFEKNAKESFTIGFGDLMISFRKRS